MQHGAIDSLGKMKVISSPLVPRSKKVQFRFPKTKKKRIMKKWRCQGKNYRDVFSREVLIIGNDMVIVHPDDYDKFRLVGRP